MLGKISRRQENRQSYDEFIEFAFYEFRPDITVVICVATVCWSLKHDGLRLLFFKINIHAT